MDAEPYFDDLYTQFCVTFPCYALLKANGHGFVTEPANDGTQALVVLTDADLLRLYRARRSTGKAVLVVFSNSDELAGVVGGLPVAVTHVTFDPARRFHRRYPVGVLGKSLAKAA